MHRSEKIYNLIYDVGERRNLYRTYEDSSKNNILHLTGKLAPSSVLNQRRGAALQLQRELQWFEEVKKLVIPKYVSKENNFMETPDMVFTREHEKLVKEAEQWMKTTAESFSITAALITTIVFAAAITVPGENKLVVSVSTDSDLDTPGKNMENTNKVCFFLCIKVSLLHFFKI
ncbi:putative PGG domain-containing protein [Helianthus annuus]|nr:putative PGG domain-containing protein [Helianthus annuus]KAJ0532662.1 putative PGG domain-containing protein [Helianthus annuus]